MNVKKIPQRKCVGCMLMKEKNELIRIVRNLDEDFVIDKTGKMNGRGAYLCKSKDCLKLAQKRKAFERSFKAAIPKEVYEKLAEVLDDG